MAEIFFKGAHGNIYLGDCLDVLRDLADNSVDLIITSPPYALIKKKNYGNLASDEYLDWFRPFGKEFFRVLSPHGSFALNIGGSWVKGQPTRSLYHFKILIMLCEEIGFHLAHEFYFWNPSKLPNPAEWCTIRKIRVKDSVEPIWWLSKTPYPKASNQRVIQPYSKSMHSLLENGYKPKLRPSGHNISDGFMTNNGGSIPPNILALPNTESNSYYLRFCAEHNLPQHPARFPSLLPEYFIRMCTDEGDLVIDPFAGSCVTGEVAERINRRWICCDVIEEFLEGAIGRFEKENLYPPQFEGSTYSLYKPGYTWNSEPETVLLDPDGGQKRKPSSPPPTDGIASSGNVEPTYEPIQQGLG